jgi:transposase
MLIIGCDFHPKFQVVAMLDMETGELQTRRLNHPQEATEFYHSLAGNQVRIGIEATGNFRWFRRLVADLGYELLLGNPSEIRASMPRNQRTDKRDAEGILRLLVENRFPVVWMPPLADEDLRVLLTHRCRLVQLRTRVKNQLDSLAKNEGLIGNRVWSQRGRQRLYSLALEGWEKQRRQDLFTVLDGLDERIAPLDRAIAEAARGRAEAQRLMTHPGVGPNVALAFVLALGPWKRFPRGKHVASYLGLIPTEESSGSKRRLGKVSKQGNTMVRWLLVQAASLAQSKDPAWHRQYLRLSVQKHHGVAKIAIAHKLAIRLYWMLRSGQDYEQVKERGSHAGQSEKPNGKGTVPAK